MKTTTTGKKVANFTLATSDKYKDKATGKEVDKTEWHRVVQWGQLAEITGKYLKKGSQVYIQGQLETRKWQDKQGTERYTTEIRCHKMQMLNGSGKTGGESSGEPMDERVSRAAQGDFSPPLLPEDDLPF